MERITRTYRAFPVNSSPMGGGREIPETEEAGAKSYSVVPRRGGNLDSGAGWKMKNQAVKFSTADVKKHRFRDGGRVWVVSQLFEAAKDLPVFDLPLRHISIGVSVWSDCADVKQIAEHVQRMNHADMSYPVIMDEDGFIMDGWHRVLKALVQELPTVKAVRFDRTPPCDFIDEG